MDMLVLSHIYPYPLHNGGSVDIFHRLQALKTLCNSLTAIAFTNPLFPPNSNDPLHFLCDQLLTLPFARREWKNLLSTVPYNVKKRQLFNSLASLLSKLQKNRFDALLVESLESFSVGKWIQIQLGIPKLFLRMHNNEVRFMHSIANSHSFFSAEKWIYHLEGVKYRFYEPKAFSRLTSKDSILHISYDEFHNYQKLYPKNNHHFLPAGIQIKDLTPYKQKLSPTILFIGSLYTPNNVAGLQWYIKHVHPKVLQKNPNVSLLVAGSTQGADTKELEQLTCSTSQVELIDTPEDVKPLYKKAAIFINPMLYGAGVKLKTVEAALNGLPIVSTPTGNEGTGFIRNIHLHVETKAQAFADKVIELLQNEKQRAIFVERSHEHLLRHYDQTKRLATILEGL